MKYVLALLLAGICFWAGRYSMNLTASVVPVNAASNCNEIESFRADFAEYQQLKTDAEKFKKADEILGKIMTIFLADLAMRVKSVPESKSAVEPVAVENKAIVHELAPPILTPSEVTASAESQQRIWLKNETLVAQATTEKELAEALKAVESKDLFSELKSGTPLKPEQVTAINGHYVGEITFFDRSSKLEVDWNAEYAMVRGKWRGTSSITLTRPGKQASSSSSKGDLGFTSVAQGQGILVKVEGGEGYLQLYPGIDGERLNGNYYKKKAIDKFTKTGTISLQRVR